ncbi:MAG: hypothetical protein ACRD12_16955 [Acidimicrobiales bacterium]
MPSRDFYPSEFTARSRAVLDEVRAIVPGAVLIGGWGTWARTRGPMSHDVDLILSRGELDVLSQQVEDLSATSHFGGRTWRARRKDVHLDLYVPYESTLGQRLELRVEALMSRQEEVEGWRVLDLPAHTCTKFAALLDRPDSDPGEKDRHEIVGLLGLGVDASEAAAVLHEASKRTPEELPALVDRAFGYLQDLDLDRRGRAGLREAAARWQQGLVGPR